jgi:hypothetical protein
LCVKLFKVQPFHFRVVRVLQNKLGNSCKMNEKILLDCLIADRQTMVAET